MLGSPARVAKYWAPCLAMVTFSTRLPSPEVTVTSNAVAPPPLSENLVALRSRSLSISVWTAALSMVFEPDIHLSPVLAYVALFSSILLGSLKPKSKSFLLR